MSTAEIHAFTEKFRVTDRRAFDRDMNRYFPDLEVRDYGSDLSVVTVHADAGESGFQDRSSDGSEHPGEIIDLVSGYLPAGEMAVFHETGIDSHGDVLGASQAINSAGDFRCLDLRHFGDALTEEGFGSRA